MSSDVYKRLAQFTLARTVTELLMYANHSINFFLYCATGQKFRQQVLTVLQVLCSRANIGRAFHRPGRGRAGGRDGPKDGRYYDADGSSCGGGTNLGRGCYRSSLSAHRTSATGLAVQEGLRVELGGRQVSPCPARRLSSYNNDVSHTYMEPDLIESPPRYDPGNMTKSQVNHAVVGEHPVNSQVLCERGPNCKAEGNLVAVGRGCGSLNAAVAARNLSNGGRGVTGTSCFSNSSKSQGCYRMCAIGPVRNCSGHHGNSITGHEDRSNDVVNCDQRLNNGTPPEPDLGSKDPWSLFKSEVIEIRENCCERKSPGVFKPFKSVSLFKKRSSKRKENKRRTSSGYPSSSAGRTEEHCSGTRFKNCRGSNSCGNVAGSSAGKSASFHGCKLHYYSNKRPTVKSKPADPSAAGHHNAKNDNEYVLLTPEMRWCDSSTSLA
ncbi:hypothetical protein EGW08_019380 [Elysia chlorotica]|uniref:Uncharacterized protein n=1 Tax=Elysia chlorotica TaxID=188477 RepID=A0A3S1B1P9_ELYCH|nr:hypothetical protein EGW08_019380 [Elysia chlorotica]